MASSDLNDVKDRLPSLKIPNIPSTDTVSSSECQSSDHSPESPSQLSLVLQCQLSTPDGLSGQAHSNSETNYE
jgi:hypothetical protein